MRGKSHPIIFRYGSPLDGILSIAFLAKGSACSSVCRLSFGSDIHSRMIFRRASCSGIMLNILCAKTLVDGSIKATLRLGKGTDSGSSDLLQDTNLRRRSPARAAVAAASRRRVVIVGEFDGQLHATASALASRTMICCDPVLDDNLATDFGELAS